METPTHQRILETRSWLQRYALRVARCFDGPLQRDDVMAIADLAMVQAWARFDPAVGCRFSTYARSWVRGAVMRAFKREHHQHALAARNAETALANRARDPLRLVAANDLVARLPPTQAEIVCRHVGRDEPLATIASDLGWHRSWVHKQYRAALATLRAEVEDEDKPR